MNETSNLANPFPGLRCFTSAESDCFFGRGEQIAEVLRLLRRHRFLAVIGASGSGKSSLIRAGVIPRIAGGLRTRAGDHWRIATMTPGNAPIDRLAAALSAPDVLGDPNLAPALRHRLQEATLRRGPLGLIDAVQEARVGDNLLLLVDQFEELFRVTPRPGEPEDWAGAFVRLLLEACAQQTVPIYVMLTMRSDFLGDCVRFQGLAQSINRSQYLIPNLTREHRREVITGPIELRGARITQPLLHRLLNDIGDDADQLTTLQHALMRTWDYWQAHRNDDEPLDLPHYQAIGTLAQALQQHADEVLAELADPQQRRITEIVFKRLTERGQDRRGIRHPTTLGDLCAVTEQSTHVLLPILDSFRRADRCFLLPGTEIPLDGQSLIDIAHESLIRVWRQLHDWADEENQAAEEYLRLVERMTRFQEGKDTYLHNPALRIALDWRERNRPNKAWADRYDCRFDEAIAFLEESEAAHRRAEAEKEETQQRELEQAKALAAEQERRYQEQHRAAKRLRLLAFALLGVFALAVIAAINAWVSSRLATDEARHSKAQGQAMAAINNLDVDPERSLLLALQAASTTYRVDGKIVPLAFSALNRAVQATASRPVLTGHGRGVIAVGFTADPGGLVSIGRDNKLVFWDSLERRIRAIAQLSDAGATVLAISAGGKQIAVGSRDGSIQIWPVASENESYELSGPTEEVSALAFSPDGGILAGADQAGKIWLWKTDTRERQHVVEGHRGRVSSLVFRPDGGSLASGGWDGAVKLWNPVSGVLERRMDRHQAAISALGYSPDGSRLASADWESGLIVWDLASGEPITQDVGHTDAVLTLAFSPDGQWLASGGRDTRVRLTNLSDGSPGPTLSCHTDAITALQFDTSGALFASAGADGEICLWDTAGWSRNGVLHGYASWVDSIAFDSDGRTLASGGDDGKVILWHLGGADKELRGLTGFQRWRPGLAVSPDGKRIAFLEKGAMVVLDAETGKQLRSFGGIEPDTYRLAFNDDGTRIATYAGKQRQPQVFFLDTRELLDQARNLVTRDLTREECHTFLFTDDCPEAPFPPDLDSTSAGAQ